jgi:hypothetical protein
MDENNKDLEIFGKKIFFLYPTGSVQSQIIDELVQQEYEVYVSKNYTQLSAALRKYANSIIFINTDEGMQVADWDRWISGMMTTVPGLRFVVLSNNSDEEFINKYLNEIHVVDYIMQKHDMSKSVDKVLEILKKENAKGRRKYIRAFIENETNATLNLPVRGNYLKGVIRDISTVGIACVFDSEPSLKTKELFKDIQIRLQSMLLKVEAIVFGTRVNGSEKTYVMLFTQRIDPEVRTKIRHYIQQNLQSKMDTELK